MLRSPRSELIHVLLAPCHSEDDTTAALTGDPGFLGRVQQALVDSAAAAAAASVTATLLPDSGPASAQQLHMQAMPAVDEQAGISAGAEQPPSAEGTTCWETAAEGQQLSGPLPPPGSCTAPTSVRDAVFVGRFKGKGWEAKKRQMQRVRLHACYIAMD